MELTYRDVRRAHSALQEISVIRDGGLKQSEGGRPAYVGRLVVPRRGKMRIRAMLRALGPVSEDYEAQEREMATEADTDNPAGMQRLQQDVRELLDMQVPGGVDVEPLRATDLGDGALDHIPDALLVGMGALFVEDGDEDGAGDPRNREERRA